MRTDELDRSPDGVEALPAEKQHGPAAGDPEQRGLALRGDDGLDRFLGPRQFDAVAGAQHLVQRLGLAEECSYIVEATGIEAQHFDCHRLPVGQAYSLDLEGLVALGYTQYASYVGPRWGSANADQTGGRFHAPGAHVLAVAGELEQMVHFRLGDEGASALVTVDPLFGLEAVQRLAHSSP